MLECRVPAKLLPLIYGFRIYIRQRESALLRLYQNIPILRNLANLTHRSPDPCRLVGAGDKETQAKGRIKHRHPLYNHGSRIVVITEANGTTVVTEFDRDNDL